jgi:hypothetical protein
MDISAGSPARNKSFAFSTMFCTFPSLPRNLSASAPMTIKTGLRLSPATIAPRLNGLKREFAKKTLFCLISGAWRGSRLSVSISSIEAWSKAIRSASHLPNMRRKTPITAFSPLNAAASPITIFTSETRPWDR